MAWANELTNLTHEITKMHKGRTKFIRNMKNETSRLLTDFHSMDKARAKEVEDLRAATQSHLAEFNKGDKVRAKEVEDLRAETQALLNEFRKADYARRREVDELKASVTNMIALFRLEREKAAAAWNDLMTNIGKAKKEIAPKEAIPDAKRKGKKASGNSYNGEKILTIIENNPSGITLPEIAYVMGVAFITIIKDVKKLLTDGLINKKENKYFLA